VARIYAKLLHSMGVIGSHILVETSGAKLAYQGPEAITKQVEKLIDIHNGGVLFVDEAYQLTSRHSPGGGRQVLDIILTEMENHIGKLVVIFTGYAKEMESFFEHNPGLSSRIPHTLRFEDFDLWELLQILWNKIQAEYGAETKIEGGKNSKYMRIAVRRLARARGTRGFGNARAVENLLHKISERQAKRLANAIRAQRRGDNQKAQSGNLNPDAQDPQGGDNQQTHGKGNNQVLNYGEFTKEDLIGPEPGLALENCYPWMELQALIGLDAVKTTALNMFHMIDTNYERELKEQTPFDFPLNRVFFGSPGTGKTTVAKLYGQILAHLGLLSRGDG